MAVYKNKQINALLHIFQPTSCSEKHNYIEKMIFRFTQMKFWFSSAITGSLNGRRSKQGIFLQSDL